MGYLGITEKDFGRYCGLFTKCKKKRPILIAPHGYSESEGPTRWSTRQWLWGPTSVLRHLAGKEAFGLFWAGRVDYLMLDFDAHRRTPEEVQETTKDVIRALPGEWLTYQSSFSQGIRAASFLDKHHPLHSAKYALTHMLEEAGFIEEKGYIESRMMGAGDRMPFGKGSMLLDPFTLEPLNCHTLQQTINYAYEFAQQNKLSIDDIIKTISQENENRSKDQTLARIERLKSEGLRPGENATDDLMLLNRHVQGYLRYGRDEAEIWLKKWIREKHNCHCDRINIGRFDLVDGQIERIVAGYNAKIYSHRRASAANYSGLPLNDLKTLLGKTRDYRTLKAAFALLTLLTQQLTTEGKLYVTRNEGKVIYVAQNSCNLACPIPSKTLRHLSGFPKNNVSWMMRELAQLGIIAPKPGYSTILHRCKEYWLLFPFSTTESPPVTGLNAGLTMIYSKTELTRIFGQYRAKQIENNRRIVDSERASRRKDDANA